MLESATLPLLISRGSKHLVGPEKGALANVACIRGSPCALNTNGTKIFK